MGEPSDFRAAAGGAPICLVRLRPYVAGLLAVFAIGCAPAAAPGPSLIVVVIDTLRSDHLSLYGYPHPTTPNLDALAHDAVVFVRCLATSPWTLPSTLSLLSGLYPERHGVESAVGQRQVSQDVELLAERLAARGRSGVVELFDLERDPGERDDRAAAEPARLVEMLAELRETQRGLAAARAAHGPSAASTPELERRLKALGYLEGPKTP